MDRDTLHRLQDRLKARPENATERLIIQTAPAAAQAAPPTPDQFASRVEYRKALIAHEQSKGAPGLDDLVERLNALGLETTVSAPSQTVIAEGAPDALSRALEEEGVEDAEIDAPISLIRPVPPDSTDP